MCGIVGWVGEGVDAAVVARMSAAVAHRGPDGDGLVEHPHAVLAARRLAITGLAHGAQPLRRGSVVALLNGQLYDFRELAAERGVTLETGCDTELLTQLYDPYDDDWMRALDGMFALAVWDLARQRLVLARDPMGKRPLYVAQVHRGLAFASELTALLVHPHIERRLDPGALRRYLVHDAVPSPGCLLQGVTKLEPGERLTWEAGTTRRAAYWTMLYERQPLRTDTEVLDALDAHLVAATRKRLPAEVPCGVLLSGGIDSSLLALIARAEQPMHAFTLGWEHAPFDERGPAAIAAQTAGTAHHVLTVSDAEATSCVPEVLAAIDEPIADDTVVSTWLLARFARQHVPVVLTGDGGDELFLGYPTFHAERAAHALDALHLARSAPLLGRLAALLPPTRGPIGLDFAARAFVRGLRFPPALRHVVWLASVAPAQQTALLSPELLATTRGLDPLDQARRHVAAITARAPTRWDVLTGVYLRLLLADTLLAKVDRAAMAHALESRSPYLDRAVVAFAAGLPRRFKVRGLTLKWALRQLARRRGLPDMLVNRKKQGFGAPMAAWLRGPLRAWMGDLLSAESLRRGGLFHPGEVERVMTEHLSGRVDHRKPLWSLLSFRAWQERVRPS